MSERRESVQQLGVSDPCQQCGACCGHFRVSFYWAEADDGAGAIPNALTEPLTPFLRCMRGTNSASHCRCEALSGQIGQSVSCTIYSQRPSTCREFQRYDENDSHNDACNRARAQYGLAPLQCVG